jgi:transglutaminase-like putative cysteine protease
MKSLPFLFVFCLLLMPFYQVMAKESKNSLGGIEILPSPVLLDQQKVIASAKEVTSEKYPDAETVLVSEHIKTEYNADGTYLTFDDEYIKVLTEEGRRGAIEKQFAYNQFYGTFEILNVEVIKANGKIIEHDAKAISKEQVDRSQMDMNIYDPNDKVIIAAVPDVEVGDTIRFYVKHGESKPRMQGCFSDWCVLEADVPIKDITYEYIGPKDKPLVSKALLSEIKGTVKSSEKLEGDRIHYSWTANDVPQVFAEAEMPSLSRVGQRLLVSTLTDWKEVSRWYHGLCQSHLEKISPDIKAKTSALMAPCKTEEEKIKAIFTFVSQEIRYMGITTETSAPGYEPHDVNITFDNRYGVCRDKAALLASMLSEAGIPSFPVLVMVGDKLDREVPSAFFNHAITAARTKDGKYVLMDSTNENTADLLPQYLYDKSYIVATAEGETLMTSPISPVEDNMAIVKTDVILADDGSATGTSVIDLKGINDVAYRGSLAEVKADEAQRFFEGALKSMIAGATLNSYKLEPENMQDTSQTIRLTLQWSVPNLLVTGGNAAQLELPFAGYGYGMAMQIMNGSLDLDERRYPLKTEYTCGVREDLTISLPPSLENPLSLPKYENTEHKDFSITQSIKVEGKTLSALIDGRVKSTEIAPADYLLLKQAMAKLQINARQQPVFSRKAMTASTPVATADVEIIKSQYEVKMDSASAWSTRQVVKKKILTYGGKKSNSELKLDYNPSYETVEIESAQVTQKDGTVKKIKAEEMNTLDADWVASAPRYPGSKTLVVSLPGVEVGALVEYAIKRTIKEQPMFSSSYAFSSGDAIDEIEFRYDFPESINPQLVIDLPKAEHMTESVNDGRRVIRFHWKDIKPQIHESSTPPAWVDAPDFALSTGSWLQYAMSVGKQVGPLTENQAATTSKAIELTKNKKSPVDKIIALRDFVAIQIRRADPSFTEFSLDHAFSAADVTLKDGYGHGADRSILLFALLKGAGFAPELVLASGGTREPTLLKRNLSLPFNGFFGALICRVKHPQTGEWLPFDMIDQYAPLGATHLDQQPGLTLDGQHFTWSAPKEQENTDETDYAINFDKEGTAVITVTTRFYGVYHAGFVAEYSEMTPEERKRDFQSLVSDISQNAVAQGELVTDLTYPGTLRYTAKVKGYGVKNDQGIYFDLPGVPQEFVSASSSYRQRALLISQENKARSTWKVTLPGGLKPIIQPENLDWAGPGTFGSILFHGSASQQNGNTVLEYSLDLDTKPVIVPTGNYKDLLDLNRHFSHPSARRVLLE